ncbi:hypothetical protein GCM10023322_70890 [Rugosimonospora acidiphila]|uniref:Uncharacterized protein n=1 Tax=Rugosimonospora acidiphila TaxID=556531 RepID=A0ABP9SKK6_9ACTN
MPARSRQTIKRGSAMRAWREPRKPVVPPNALTTATPDEHDLRTESRFDRIRRPRRASPPRRRLPAANHASENRRNTDRALAVHSSPNVPGPAAANSPHSSRYPTNGGT